MQVIPLLAHLFDEWTKKGVEGYDCCKQQTHVAKTLGLPEGSTIGLEVHLDVVPLEQSQTNDGQTCDKSDADEKFTRLCSDKVRYKNKEYS